MLGSPLSRTVVVLSLLGLLFGLAVWYGSLPAEPGVGAYPGADELAADYDRYLGDRVVVGGTVISTDPIVIEDRYAPEATLRLTISGATRRVSEGDPIRVYGVAREENTVRAIDVVRHSRVGQRIMYVLSFLAGLWVLGRLIATWRIDRERWGLTPRETPIAVGSVVRTRLSAPEPGEDSDA